jgi:hypothetical protein
MKKIMYKANNGFVYTKTKKIESSTETDNKVAFLTFIKNIKNSQILFFNFIILLK